MLLAACSVYLCQYYNVSFDIHVCLFVSPIVFPLAFCINTDFQRREKVLEDLANFRSSSMIFYFCMRDWKRGAQLTNRWLAAVQLKVSLFSSMEFHISLISMLNNLPWWIGNHFTKERKNQVTFFTLTLFSFSWPFLPWPIFPSFLGQFCLGHFLPGQSLRLPIIIQYTPYPTYNPPADEYWGFAIWQPWA